MKEAKMDYYENYPKSTIVVGNLLVILLVAVGAYGMLPLTVYNVAIASVLYVLFAVVMVVFVLRKVLCTDCHYYGKWCNVGWGKLAALMFKEGSGNKKLADRVVPLTWGTVMAAPLMVMIALIVSRAVPLYSELPSLVAFIAIMGLTQLSRKALCCAHCKNRDTCSGSAAKK